MSHSSERQVDSMAAARKHHEMRSSPPIQVGEMADKLPSFSEFLKNTREDTPPRTPQHRNGSNASSPHARPQFEEVAWQDRKEGRDGRHDTLMDIYACHGRQNPTEGIFSYQRRASSNVEPASNYCNPARETMNPGYGDPRRQSSTYAPQPAHAPAVANSRYESPAPPHPAYRQPPAHPGMAGPSAYHSPTVAGPSHDPHYGHRQPSYYQEPPPAAHPYGYDHYGRPQYTGIPHPVYTNGYGDNIRFHHNVGMDHNNFTRKRRGNLPKEATNMFKAWYADHIISPYPSEDQKAEMSAITGLTLNQISNWFINARRRAPGKEARDREAKEAAAAKRNGRAPGPGPAPAS